MGKIKLKNEKATIISFTIVSVIVLGLSAFFFYKSFVKDELGGIIIASMLGFISAYGIIVFIGRLLNYKKVAAVQKLIIDENVTSISSLSEKLQRTEASVVKSVQFLIDNGYLGSFYIYGDKIVDKELQNKLNEERMEETIEYQKLKMEEETRKIKKAREIEAQKENELSTVKCPRCGATETFKGSQETCDYCGYVLNKNK